MKPYSQDLRRKVVAAYNNHEGSQREIAQRFCVSISFVQSILKRYRSSGTVEPRPHGGGQPLKLNPEQMVLLSQLVQENPHFTLLQLCETVRLMTGVKLSRATMGRTIHKLGLQTNRQNSRVSPMFDHTPKVKVTNPHPARIPQKEPVVAIAPKSARISRLSA